jgi:hypothetical protein
MRGVTNFTAAQQRYAADSGYRRRQSSLIRMMNLIPSSSLRLISPPLPLMPDVSPMLLCAENQLCTIKCL